MFARRSMRCSTQFWKTKGSGKDRKSENRHDYRISHYLRTPLTSIRGYIKGVLDGVADTEEKRKRYLETAYESTEEMNQLLRKLFDFSRMESGQMPFHMIKADLAEYAASYVAQKEVTADPRKLKFLSHKKEEADSGSPV